MKKIVIIFLIAGLVTGCGQKPGDNFLATQDDGEYFFLDSSDIQVNAQHFQHAAVFGKYVSGYNRYILQGIDVVQQSAPDGGGYFVGIRTVPTESPVGYELKLMGHPLLDPPRTTSYCSGASFSAFIEGLNFIFEKRTDDFNNSQLEAMRMQEPDGSRREDGIKAWGYWNADGFGSQFALVQYLAMGDEIKPQNARPGDFVNVSWKSGLGHSVVFLGWYKKGDQKYLLYWSSQRGTNGLGDQLVNIDRIKSVKFVRLTRPDNLFRFDINAPVITDVPGDTIRF